MIVICNHTLQSQQNTPSKCTYTIFNYLICIPNTLYGRKVNLIILLKLNLFTSLSFQCNFNWYPDRMLCLFTSSKASMTAGLQAWPPCHPPLPPIGNIPPMCKTFSSSCSWNENDTLLVSSRETITTNRII